MNPAATRIGPPAARSAGTGEAVLGFTGPRAAWATLASLLLFFFLLESFVPLRTAIQIGGDEGFELAKATLCLKGHSLYTEVWNDQPPLHTLLNTELLRLTGPGKRVMQPENYTRILWPRLLTVAFATLLITAFFLLLKNISGFATASLACAFLIASPGVLGLSASCMLEIPAVSLGMAALYILARAQQSLRPRRSQVLTALAGAVLGLSLLSKLVTITLFPAFGALICVSATHEHGRPRRFDWMVILKTVVLPIGSAIITFLAVDLLIEKGAYLTHFHQSWTSHFAPAVSFEYGSAADHPFPWSVLLKHWDATLPAGVSLAVLLLTTRNQTGRTFLPFFWLGASLLIFGLHQPWWSYYYIHIAVPLAWCAASGLVLLWSFAMRHRALLLAVVLYATLALLWTGSRLYLQIASTRNSPQTFSSPVLTEMARFKPFTQWLYTDDPIYSFHADIPLPPDLAVIMLKRLWSGEMTNDKIAAELTKLLPGLILLGNDSRGNPLKTLLEAQYDLVYIDEAHRLQPLQQQRRVLRKRPGQGRRDTSRLDSLHH